MDEDQNGPETELDEYGTDYGEPEAEDEPLGGEEPEAEAQEAAEPESPPPVAPFRPQFSAPAAEQAEAWLRENAGEDVYNALDVLINARLSSSRQAETVSGHYAGQIDSAAPGFLGVEERTMLRQLPPQQQADPGAAFLASASRYMRKAQETGDVTGALDAFASEWQSKRGKQTAAAPPVLPPSQRVGAAPGGSAPSASRPVRPTRPAGASRTVAAIFGVDEGEADGYIRASKRG